MVNQLCASGTLPAALHAQPPREEPSGLEQAARLLLTALAGHHLLEDDAGSNSDGRAPDLQSVELEVRFVLFIFALKNL